MEMEFRTCIKENCSGTFTVNKDSKQKYCSQYCRLRTDNGSLVVRENNTRHLSPAAKRAKREYYQNFKMAFTYE